MSAWMCTATSCDNRINDGNTQFCSNPKCLRDRDIIGIDIASKRQRQPVTRSCVTIAPVVPTRKKAPRKTGADGSLKTGTGSLTKKAGKGRSPARQPKAAASGGTLVCVPQPSLQPEADADDGGGSDVAGGHLVVGDTWTRPAHACSRCDALSKENAALHSQLESLRQHLQMALKGRTCSRCMSANTEYSRAELDSCDDEGRPIVMGWLSCGDCLHKDWACWKPECGFNTIVHRKELYGGTYTCIRCWDEVVERF